MPSLDNHEKRCAKTQPKRRGSTPLLTAQLDYFLIDKPAHLVLWPNYKIGYKCFNFPRVSCVVKCQSTSLAAAFLADDQAVNCSFSAGMEGIFLFMHCCDIALISISAMWLPVAVGLIWRGTLLNYALWDGILQSKRR